MRPTHCQRLHRARGTAAAGRGLDAVPSSPTHCLRSQLGATPFQSVLIATPHASRGRRSAAPPRGERPRGTVCGPRLYFGPKAAEWAMNGGIDRVRDAPASRPRSSNVHGDWWAYSGDDATVALSLDRLRTHAMSTTVLEAVDNLIQRAVHGRGPNVTTTTAVAFSGAAHLLGQGEAAALAPGLRPYYPARARALAGPALAAASAGARADLATRFPVVGTQARPDWIDCSAGAAETVALATCSPAV